MNGLFIAGFALVFVSSIFLLAYRSHDISSGSRLRKPRPSFYALTLAVYCTSWTFFGSIGFAEAKGFDFIAVYLGPIAALALAAPLFRRIIRISKTQNITSISDFIAARYGKNSSVAALVTLIAVVGLLPYIALQVKAITQSMAMLAAQPGSGAAANSKSGQYLPETAVVLALYILAILFGAHREDHRQHRSRLMLAIAVESIVKLAAFVSTGAFVVFVMFGGIGPLLEKAAAHPEVMTVFSKGIHGGTLLTVAFLSFVCIFLLPRQFHVTVVENISDRELRRASWLFPLYLILINLFVVPVAIAGLLVFPRGAVDPDMILLALPIHAHSPVFAGIAFAGGLSAATAMVVVESAALAIMVCNDLAMPVILRLRSADAVADMSGLLLNLRRGVILGILLLATVFHRALEQEPLASIGLLSFAAIAQFAPAFFGGLIWRRATARGAIAGMAAGFAVWVYTLALPAMIEAGLISRSFLDGPFGLTALSPEKLFYFHFEPLTHGVVWSLFANICAFVTVSLARQPQSIERLQANAFIDDPAPRYGARSLRASVTVEDLMTAVARYLGAERTQRSFDDYAETRGIDLHRSLEADVHTVRFTETLLASAIGSASSRLVMSMTIKRRNAGSHSALKLLDDASEAFQYNRELLQTALDHVHQGLAVFDTDMRLICWNRQFCEILVLPQSFVRIGTPLDRIVRQVGQSLRSDATSIENFVTDRIGKYVVTREPFHERLADDRVIDVRINAMPQGGIAVTYMDITERVTISEALTRANDTLERRVAARTAELTAVNRQLEDARAKADEASLSKTRFLAAASHDILQPLNAARLYATSLIERSPPLEIGRLARNVDASLEAVEDILTALLDVSRLDTGAVKPEFSTFPIREVLDQLRVDFEPIAKARGLSFTIVPSSFFVRSDKRLLRRVLQNLVSNALKFTDSGGVILGCRKRGRVLNVQVHDTGRGIAATDRDLIFREFERLRQKQQSPGLGLGLSIVDRMCRVLDHPLTLSSKVGHGSTFTVGLPLARWSDAEKPRPFGLRPAAYGDLRGAVALCLDNERAILDGMNSLLTGWQCAVLTAFDSADAISQIRAAKVIPDIILSDYHLDNQNGLEALQDICVSCQASIPSIVVTADRSASLKDAVASAGCAILYKPVKPASLRALMAQTIAQRRAAE